MGERDRGSHRERKIGVGERETGMGDRTIERERERERTISRETEVGETYREKEREISIGKNKEYKKEIIFYMDVLKTIHKKISNQKMKSRERDKSILEYVQCMYNNVHTYKVPGF